MPGQTLTRAACRILLVEDDELIRISTAALLEDLGHEVLEAASAGSAMALLRGGARVHLVITDHAMPGRTGAELLGDIRAEWPELPVIIATGYADSRGLTDGAPRLRKPFLSDDLERVIAPFLPASDTT